MQLQPLRQKTRRLELDLKWAMRLGLEVLAELVTKKEAPAWAGEKDAQKVRQMDLAWAGEKDAQKVRASAHPMNLAWAGEKDA